jgi:hypothetical protein
MPTSRETILTARLARLSALPATTLCGEVLPERVPADGLLILRDGEPGEPEVTLSPLRYHYRHRAEIEAVSVRVVVRRPDAIVGFGETRIHAETTVFDVRTAEVTDPRSGDRLTLDGVAYVIQGAPERRDPDRLIWTLDGRPS